MSFLVLTRSLTTLILVLAGSVALPTASHADPSNNTLAYTWTNAFNQTATCTIGTSVSRSSTTGKVVYRANFYGCSPRIRLDDEDVLTVMQTNPSYNSSNTTGGVCSDHSCSISMSLPYKGRQTYCGAAYYHFNLKTVKACKAL